MNTAFELSALAGIDPDVIHEMMILEKRAIATFARNREKRAMIRNVSTPKTAAALETLAQAVTKSELAEADILVILETAEKSLAAPAPKIAPEPKPTTPPAKPTTPTPGPTPTPEPIEPAARLAAINALIESATGRADDRLAGIYAKGRQTLAEIRAELIPLARQSRAFGRV